MNKLLLCLSLFTCSIYLQAQNHIEDLYTSLGSDLDIIRGIEVTEDSVYAMTDFNGDGELFRIALDGTGGYASLATFDPTTSTNALELKIRNNVIYGTTGYGDGVNGQLFKYSLDDYSFEVIRSFSLDEPSRNEIKYLTDSVIWGHSQSSGSDYGSIFTINYDGTGFTKVYSQDIFDNGGDPVDIAIANNRIFIACYNYGGIPYDDGFGSTYSGSITSVDTEGNNYLKIKQGEDLVGTQPIGLVVYEDKLYGLFQGAGTDNSAKLFSVNFDGTDYTQLYDFDGIGRGDLILDNGKIVGITTNQLFSYDPTSNETTILNTYSNQGSVFLNSGPVKINNGYVVGFQKGESDAVILSKWINTPPTMDNSIENQLINEGEALTINLSEYFSDPEGDVITYDYSLSNSDGVEASIQDGILTITGNSFTTLDVTYIARDEFGAESSFSFELEVNAPTEQILEFSNMIEQEGFTETTLDLTNYFEDRNGDVINYQVTSSNDGIASVSIANDVLTITEANIGVVVITIEATDSKSDPLEATFEVKVNGAPNVDVVIDDVLVNEGFTSYEIDLTNHISDPNSDELSYELTVGDETVVTASVAENVLTITEAGIGVSSLDILIDDSSGGTTTTTFNFTVNGLPEAVTPIEIVQSRPGFVTAEIDFNGKFSDPDDDPLSYEVAVSDATLLTASVTDGVVTITEVAEGFATVSITVRDGRGGSTTATIFDLVLGIDLNNEFEIYPNPSSNYIVLPFDKIEKVDIISLDGKIQKTESNPDSKIDISNLEVGVYIIRLEKKDAVLHSRLIKK